MGRMTRNKMNAPVPSVATHVMNCPIWLDQIVTQMLQPAPKKRPHSARAISFAFDEIKNIDQTKKAAVAQVSGKFNPLNAGKDKTEANRLLGIKKKKKESDIPFYQGVPFLVGCLILIAFVIGFALIPPSPSKLFARGEALMESERVGDWRKARGFFEKVIARSKDDELVSNAEDLLSESKRRTLVQQAEGKGIFLRYQRENARKFGEAVQHAQQGRTQQARKLFEELTKTIAPDSDERHILTEARTRLADIEAAEPALPTEPSEIMALLAPMDQPSTESELIGNERLLSRLIFQYAGEQDYIEVVSLSKSLLESVKQRLKQGEFIDGSNLSSIQTGSAQEVDSNSEAYNMPNEENILPNEENPENEQDLVDDIDTNASDDS